MKWDMCRFSCPRKHRLDLKNKECMLKKLTIALTVAALGSGAFAQGGNGGAAGLGGNGGAIVEDPSRGSLAPNMRSGGTGGKGGGGNGGAVSPFDEWDLDRNGVLSNSEALSAGFTEAQFLAMDTDRDGKVTIKEFTVASIIPIRGR